MRLFRASSSIAPLALLVLGGSPSLADTITIEEATYGTASGGDRLCSATAYFVERCGGRENCTVEISPEAAPCEVPGLPAGSGTIRVRYSCGGSTSAVAASGRSTVLRLSCSGSVVRSR